jgi:hypothetical protein
MFKLFLLSLISIPLALGAAIQKKESSGWPYLPVQAPFEATTGLLGAGLAPELYRNPLTPVPRS